jgi:hypothetical protein
MREYPLVPLPAWPILSKMPSVSPHLSFSVHRSPSKPCLALSILSTGKGHDEQAVLKAISVQSARGKYKTKRQGKDLERIQP